MTCKFAFYFRPQCFPLCKSRAPRYVVQRYSDKLKFWCPFPSGFFSFHFASPSHINKPSPFTSSPHTWGKQGLHACTSGENSQISKMHSWEFQEAFRSSVPENKLVHVYIPHSMLPWDKGLVGRGWILGGSAWNQTQHEAKLETEL